MGQRPKTVLSSVLNESNSLQLRKPSQKLGRLSLSLDRIPIVILQCLKHPLPERLPMRSRMMSCSNGTATTTTPL